MPPFPTPYPGFLRRLSSLRAAAWSGANEKSLYLVRVLACKSPCGLGHSVSHQGQKVWTAFRKLLFSTGGSVAAADRAPGQFLPPLLPTPHVAWCQPQVSNPHLSPGLVVFPRSFPQVSAVLLDIWIFYFHPFPEVPAASPPSTCLCKIITRAPTF